MDGGGERQQMPKLRPGARLEPLHRTEEVRDIMTCRAYAEEKGIRALLHNLTAKLMLNQPDDPEAFLYQHFQGRFQGTGRATGQVGMAASSPSSLDTSQHLGLAAWEQMAATGQWLQLQYEHDRRARELNVDEIELPRVQQAASVRPHPTRPGSFRVLQWNVLAEGLSDDGFLVRDVLRKDLPDLPPDTTPFEEMIAEVSKVKKENGDLKSLKAKYDTPRSRSNYRAVIDWRRRWAQIKAFIINSAPDIITLQELDHMADAQRELRALGYTCSLAGSDSPYRPIHKEITGEVRREDKAFLAHLKAVGVAYMPKTFSNCRKFGLKSNPDADDDGVAIFWREDAFKATSIDFLSFDDPKRNQGAVLVHLERLSDGAPLTVISTHLSSGTKDKDRKARVHECTAPSVDANGELKAPSLREWFASQKTPTLLCIDMNEGPTHQGEAGKGGEAAAESPWSLLHDGEDVRSVWDSYFNLDGSGKRRGAGRTLVTTNKMRGPLSDQPGKIGEHAFEAIDHVFYRNGSQEEAGEQWQLRMLQHAWGPLEFESRDAALQTILPSLEVPSDHSPVIVDLSMFRKTSGGAAATRTPAPEQGRASSGVPARLRKEVIEQIQRSHEQLLRIESKSLLVDAVSNADVELVQRLLQVDIVDPDATDDAGCTPMMVAAKSGSSLLVDLLAKAGADLERTDSHGRTALMWAAMSNASKTVEAIREMMEEQKINWKEAKDKDGFTALMHAQYVFSRECVKKLSGSGGENTLMKDRKEALQQELLGKKRAELADCGRIVSLNYYGWYGFESAMLVQEGGSQAQRSERDRNATGVLETKGGAVVGRVIRVAPGSPFRHRLRFDAPGMWVDRKEARGDVVELYFREDGGAGRKDEVVRLKFKTTLSRASAGGAEGMRIMVRLCLDSEALKQEVGRVDDKVKEAAASTEAGMELRHTEQFKQTVCGTIKTVQRTGYSVTFDLNVDNRELAFEKLTLDALMPYQCDKLRLEEGTALVVHTEDGKLVDATVVAPPDKLGNEHQLLIDGKRRPFDLNEYNHCTQALSAQDYEKHRLSFCEGLMTEGKLVEDAITGKKQDIKEQLLRLDMRKEAELAYYELPRAWQQVKSVSDFREILLGDTGQRACGASEAHYVLLRAGPGTGKTWSMLQLHFLCAEKLVAQPDIKLVPLLIRVQKLVRLMRKLTKEQAASALVELYIDSEYAQQADVRDMLKQAFKMRAVVLLFDGIDEAAGLKEAIEDYITDTLVPLGIRLVATSRPEGVRLWRYLSGWSILNLAQLDEEQQKKAVSNQLENSTFFENALRFTEIRRGQDEIYAKEFSEQQRGELEDMSARDLFKMEDGKTWNPELRQMALVEGDSDNARASKFLLRRNGPPKSRMLTNLNAAFRHAGTFTAIGSKLKELGPNATRKELEAALKELGSDVARRLLELAGNPELQWESVKWKEVDGDGKPAEGRELGDAHAELRTALASGTTDFTRERWADLGVKDLCKDDHVKSGDTYFQPVSLDVGVGLGMVTVRLGLLAHQRKESVEALWPRIQAQTDELYVAAESFHDAFREAMASVAGGQGHETDQTKKEQGEAKAEEEQKEKEQGSKEDETKALGLKWESAGGAQPEQGCKLENAELAAALESGKTEFTEQELAAFGVSDLRPDAYVQAGDAFFTPAAAGTETSDKHPAPEVSVAPLKDPVRAFEKAAADYGDRFDDGVLAEACVCDILRSSVICSNAGQLIQILCKLKEGFAHTPTGGGPELKVSLARMKNKASKAHLDPTRFRNVLCNLRLERGGMVHVGEMQVHHRRIWDYNISSHAHDQYEFFRSALGGSYGSTLNATLERTIEFLEEAKGVPVLLSMLVLVFEAREEASKRGDKAALPASRLELYQMATAAVLARLFPDSEKDRGLADAMLSRVSVANMLAQRREFLSTDVNEALQEHAEELELWNRLLQEDKLPLVKVLAVASETEAAEFQFKHLSFSEAYFARHLIATAKTWQGWATDAHAARFVNDAFHANTCRIGGEALGRELARRRASWNLSGTTREGQKPYRLLLMGAADGLRQLAAEDVQNMPAIEPLIRSATLQELSLKFSFRPEILQKWTAGLRHNTVLERASFVLADMPVPEQVVADLRAWLSTSPSLTIFNISAVRLRGKLDVSFLDGKHRLRELRLQDCNLEGDSLRVIAAQLKAEHCALRLLDLGNNRALCREPGAVQEFADALAVNTTLEALLLDSVEEEEEEEEEVENENVSVLKWRDIGGEKPKEGQQLDCQALAEALTSGQTEFSQEEWDAFEIKQLQAANYIQAGASYFTPSPGSLGQCLAAGLQGNKALHTLSLSLRSTSLGGEGASALAGALAARRRAHGAVLHKLDLRDAGLSDASCEALREAFEGSGSACELNVDGNNGIGPAGAAALAKLLAAQPADVASLFGKTTYLALQSDADATPARLRLLAAGLRAGSVTGLALHASALPVSTADERDAAEELRQALEAAPTLDHVVCSDALYASPALALRESACGQRGRVVLRRELDVGSVGTMWVSADGSRLYVAGRILPTPLIEFDLASKREIRRFEGHSQPILAVVESASGDRLYSGSRDTTIRVWNAREGDCEMTLAEHSKAVRDVRESADGGKLFSCSDDTTVRVWDAHHGQLLLTLEGHRGAVTCICVVGGGGRLVSGSEDTTMRVWDVATGACLRVLEGNSKPVERLFATGGGAQLRCVAGHSVMLWHMQDADFKFVPQATFEVAAGPREGPDYVRQRIFVSEDGSRLATVVIDEGNMDAPTGFICSSSIHIYNVDGGTRELVMSRLIEFPMNDWGYASKSFSSVCLHANLRKLFTHYDRLGTWEWDLPSAG